MRENKEKGITLIALIITVIILLILAAISFSTAKKNNGIRTKTEEARYTAEEVEATEDVKLATKVMDIEDEEKDGISKEEKRKIIEDELKKIKEDSVVEISEDGFLAKHKEYDIYINDYGNVINIYSEDKWNREAAPEDVFIWKSDDPSSEDYGVIVGYTAKVDNYPILKYPTRSTKIQPYWGNDKESIRKHKSEETIRSYTSNIKRIELPPTVKEIGYRAFSSMSHGYYFSSLEEIDISEGPTSIDEAFWGCKNLKSVVIPRSITSISSYSFYGIHSEAVIKIRKEKDSISGAPWGLYWSWSSNNDSNRIQWNYNL